MKLTVGLFWWKYNFCVFPMFAYDLAKAGLKIWKHKKRQNEKHPFVKDEICLKVDANAEFTYKDYNKKFFNQIKYNLKKQLLSEEIKKCDY